MAVVERAEESRTAAIYDAEGCSGDTVGAKANFGCQGECFSTDGPGFSILLTQGSTGNPKPTASLFSDSNCRQQIGSAGIFKKEHSGCTTFGKEIRSYRVYYNC